MRVPGQRIDVHRKLLVVVDDSPAAALLLDLDDSIRLEILAVEAQRAVGRSSIARAAEQDRRRILATRSWSCQRNRIARLQSRAWFEPVILANTDTPPGLVVPQKVG